MPEATYSGGGSDDPELDIDSSEPTEVNSSVVNFLSDGGDVATVITGMITGLGTSVFIGIGDIVNAVVGFITSPFKGGADAIEKLISGILGSPGEILDTTAQTTGTAISEQFGWMAYPVGVAVVLGSLYLVVQYLEQRETGDTFVGLPFDTPDFGPFDIGVTEEGEDER